MSPSSLAEELLAAFKPQEPREEAFVEAIRELVALHAFDSRTGKLAGPRLNIASIARRAALPRGLVSHEESELPRVRELVLAVLEKLSAYSLQIQCDFLKEENERLRARLDRYDSMAANRVVMLHKKLNAVQPTPPDKYTAEDVLAAAAIIPMHHR